MSTILPYQDPQQPIETRVQDLLGRMTLEEKIAQIGSVWVYELLNDQRLNPDKVNARLVQGIGKLLAAWPAPAAWTRWAVPSWAMRCSAIWLRRQD